jgi:hypothetical protein
MRHRRVGRAVAALAWCVGVPSGGWLVAACGQTRTTFADDPPVAGKNAGGAAGGGSVSGGATGQAGVAAGGRSGAAGSAEAGAAGARPGGSSNTGGSGGESSGGAAMGEGGAGGAPDRWLGVDCRDQRCLPGNVCVTCTGASGLQGLCAPHPTIDSDGYAEATAQCEPRPREYDECDGPEDCAENQYCVARQGGDDGGQRCRDMPSPASGSCCFTCGALPDCTLCRDDSDCPEGRSCSVVYEALMGCKRN